MFLNSVLTIAYRDILKFLRDRTRILASLIFPVLFVGVLGTSIQSGFGNGIYDGNILLTLIFLGVVAQTLFQSTASGIISLIEDRENDFSQEMFVSPTSRYSILIGKILGESIVSFVQVIGVIGFGLIAGVSINFQQILSLAPYGIIVALLGGGFGIIILANLNSQRAANQVFPFIMFPQFILAGVFAPITNLEGPLLVLSRISPLTYAVDLLRGLIYYDTPGVKDLIINSPIVNLGIIIVLFFVFLIIGTFLFVRNEKNR